MVQLDCPHQSARRLGGAPQTEAIVSVDEPSRVDAAAGLGDIALMHEPVAELIDQQLAWLPLDQCDTRGDSALPARPGAYVAS